MNSDELLTNESYKPMSDKALDEWERRVDEEIKQFLIRRSEDKYSDAYWKNKPIRLDPAVCWAVIHPDATLLQVTGGLETNAQSEMEDSRQYLFLEADDYNG